MESDAGQMVCLMGQPYRQYRRRRAAAGGLPASGAIGLREKTKDNNIMDLNALIVVSSRTGNTHFLAKHLEEHFARATLVAPTALPEDLSGFDVELLGYWCDRGQVPEDLMAVASRFHHQKLWCFATMGAEPDDERSQAWIAKTAKAVSQVGEGNTLLGHFVCQGRIDPEVFRRVTEMVGGLTPEREARRLRAEQHPNEDDARAAFKAFEEDWLRDAAL